MEQHPGKDLRLVGTGAVLLLLWFLVLRPVNFEYADGNTSDGPEPGGVPWNTVLRDPVAWEHNGTSGVLSECGHGWCPVSLRTDDGGGAGMWGALYWRVPWSSSGTLETDVPREVLEHQSQSVETDDLPALVPHRVSAATYHARDPAVDLGVVAVGLPLLRLGLGGDRARPAALAWAATVPFAPFVAPLSYTILTPFFPSLILVLLGLGVRWTWQRPRVRRATDALFEAAAVLAVLGIAMVSYFTPPPLA